MSQRASGYRRQPLDDYQTREAWVTQAVIPCLNKLGLNQSIWEPASGEGFMARALRHEGFWVHVSDIHKGKDFLKTKELPKPHIEAIITNPPYSHAVEFIEHALKLAKDRVSHDLIIAMLLRCDFDSAKTRQHLFGDCSQFALKLVLTKRINWFEHRIASPSFNHAWYIWDTAHTGSAAIEYYYGEPTTKQSTEVQFKSRVLRAIRRGQKAPK